MIRPPRCWLAVFLVCLCGAAAPCGLTAADESPSARVFRVERWLKDALAHAPGADDPALEEVRHWSSPELETLRIDESVVLQLMEDPKQLTFLVSTSARAGTAAGKSRAVIPYSSRELHRLRVLVCAATGNARISPTCKEQLHAPSELDEELLRLNDAVYRSTPIDAANLVLRRGAILHGDAEMFGGAILDLPSGASGPFRIEGKDGRQTNAGFGGTNWDAADMLLDAVKPAPDAMVRMWYRATASWMQREGRHLAAHIDHASEMFPGAADILFLSGCQHEVYASPLIQAVAESAVMPPGRVLEVKSERTELTEAETYFKRAIAAAPAMGEAHLRLGHVLLARNKPDEAVRELRQASTSLGDPQLQYFDEMFLGAALEALKQPEAARAAYARAAALYPSSQSAALALSALAMRSGDRATGGSTIARMFDTSDDDSAARDPWWSYYTAQARNADALLGKMYAPLLRTP